jgi:hypothetical protein
MDKLIPEQRVLYAAINLAIFDACKQPIIAGELIQKSKKHKDYKLHADARTAFQFIWGEGLENFCLWIPLDPGWLRNKLLEFMYDPKPRVSNSNKIVLRIDDKQRRMFRINYKLFKQEKEPCWKSPEEESQVLPIKQVRSRLDQNGLVLDRTMSVPSRDGTRKFQKISSGFNAFTSMSQYLSGPGLDDGQEPSEDF